MRLPFLQQFLLSVCGGLLLCALPHPVLAQGLSYAGAITIGETVMPDIAKAFTSKTGTAFGKIDKTSSTEGFKSVMAGEVALAGVARPLTSEEKALKPHFVVLGFDVNSVYVNETNPVQSLSLQQVKEIFTGKITNWQQVGGTNAPIEVVVGESSRATTQEFQRLALDGETFRPTRTLPNVSACLQHVASHPPHAITYGSLALAVPGIKTIQINNITPNPDNVRSQAYPLRRPLLLVSKEAPRGDLKKFFDFAQSDEGQTLVAKYFVPFKPLQSTSNR